MLKQLFVSCLVFFVIDLYAQKNIDVLHYRFSIDLNDANDTIYGTAEIKMRFLAEGRSAELDLAGLNKNKGMIVSAASFVMHNLPQPAFSHSNGKLVINQAGSFSKGDTVSALIEYKGIPSDGLIISKNKYGHRSFFADNWPNRGHNWLPCVDDPGDKATVEFIVTAPQHYQVVANGIQIEETSLAGGRRKTHWREDVPVATKVMVIGAAGFAVSLSGMVDGCIPVYSWVYPEDRDKGFYDYAQAADILPFFIKNVGPYGYRKLANVQSKTTFGGLENANTIFYYENSVDGTRRSEALIVHEIAHQWFGNMATEKSFAHLWLSEGFATYMTILYMENKYGKDTARSMLAKDREEVIAFAGKSKLPVVNETKNYMELLNANSYQKGGWILHMLRRQLGDTVFYRAVRNYYAGYAGKNADTRDLQTIFEKTAGKDLSGFFDQWLYAGGIPRLNIKWHYQADKKQLVLEVGQLQENLFTFPLEIEMKSSSGARLLKTIPVSKKQQTFTWPVKDPVSEIVLDPGMSLLFEATLSPDKKL